MDLNKISIITLNVNGLRDSVKINRTVHLLQWLSNGNKSGVGNASGVLGVLGPREWQ